MGGVCGPISHCVIAIDHSLVNQRFSWRWLIAVFTQVQLHPSHSTNQIFGCLCLRTLKVTAKFKSNYRNVRFFLDICNNVLCIFGIPTNLLSVCQYMKLGLYGD